MFTLNFQDIGTLKCFDVKLNRIESIVNYNKNKGFNNIEFLNFLFSVYQKITRRDLRVTGHERCTSFSGWQ